MKLSVAWHPTISQSHKAVGFSDRKVQSASLAASFAENGQKIMARIEALGRRVKISASQGFQSRNVYGTVRLSKFCSKGGVLCDVHWPDLVLGVRGFLLSN